DAVDRERMEPDAPPMVHLPRLHEVGEALGEYLDPPAEEALLALDLPLEHHRALEGRLELPCWNS
ncbi:MAG: hypothetical protein WBW04_07010, partial [Nitrolancea sp.]